MGNLAAGDGDLFRVRRHPDERYGQRVGSRRHVGDTELAGVVGYGFPARRLQLHACSLQDRVRGIRNQASDDAFAFLRISRRKPQYAAQS